MLDQQKKLNVSAAHMFSDNIKRKSPGREKNTDQKPNLKNKGKIVWWFN